MYNRRVKRTIVCLRRLKLWYFFPSASWLRVHGDYDTYTLGEDIKQSTLDNFLSRGMAREREADDTNTKDAVNMDIAGVRGCVLGFINPPSISMIKKPATLPGKDIDDLHS